MTSKAILEPNSGALPKPNLDSSNSSHSLGVRGACVRGVWPASVECIPLLGFWASQASPHAAVRRCANQLRCVVPQPCRCSRAHDGGRHRRLRDRHRQHAKDPFGDASAVAQRADRIRPALGPRGSSSEPPVVGTSALYPAREARSPEMAKLLRQGENERNIREESGFSFN